MSSGKVTSPLQSISSLSSVHSFVSDSQNDYVDKAFAAAEKKIGQMSGRKIDPNSAKMRSTNEKIVRFPSRTMFLLKEFDVLLTGWVDR